MSYYNINFLVWSQRKLSLLWLTNLIHVRHTCIRCVKLKLIPLSVSSFPLFLLFSCWTPFFTFQVKEPIQEWSLTLKAHILELKPLNVTHALSLSFFLRTLAYSHFLANKIASRTITQLFFTIISFLIDLKLPIYGRWVGEKRSNNVQSNDHKKKMNLQVCLNLKLLLWYS